MALSNVQTETIEWRANLKGLRGFLLASEKRRYRAALGVAQRLAPQIRQWLRENAPWEDQTGRARASLDCIVEESNTGAAFKMVIKGGGGSVNYMTILEFDHAGRYSVILPAMEHWVPIFRDEVALAIRRVK